MLKIGQILSEHQEAVIDAWLDRMGGGEGDRTLALSSLPLLRLELSEFLQQLTTYFLNDAPEAARDLFGRVEERASAISAARARDGFRPTDTARLVLDLKGAAGEALVRASAADPGALADMRATLDAVVDRLALVTFSTFVETREQVIRRQGQALLDLATPALPIWRHIVLMPLVGIIDTQRARQVMEWLLDALSREEAHIAILDVTGVPLIDSRVALHLTKTVEAARLLGARVIVTGISPDAAQTLVKLDVDLSSMITRGNLRAGLAEAFRLLGQTPQGVIGGSR